VVVTRYEVRGALRRIERLMAVSVDAGAVSAAVHDLVKLLSGSQNPPEYHPAHDRVTGIRIRALAERVFRSQQQPSDSPAVALLLEIETDRISWFPARLEHILDTLFSTALRLRDPERDDPWVFLGLRATAGAYELRVSDNGVGMPAGEGLRAFELLARTAPVRDRYARAEMPVVRLLVEQGGGSITVRSEAGWGTDFVLTLPRHDFADL
jgi:signal transduction histidine kinase